MPIVYYPCLTLGQAWNLIENLSAFLKYRHMGHWNFFPLSQTCGRASVLSFKTAGISKTGNLFPPDSVQFRHFYRKRSGRRNRKKKRDGSNKYLYELDFSSALKTARKFFMRRDSSRHIDIIRLMMKYVHAVKDRFRQFQRPLRGISAIHFGYR